GHFRFFTGNLGILAGLPAPHAVQHGRPPAAEESMATRAPKKKTATPARSRTSPAHPDFRLATYPFYRVTRIAGLYAQCLDHELKPRGMDQPRSRVLMLLSEHSPSAMGELAEKTVMK